MIELTVPANSWQTKRVLALALALGWSADLLFYGKAVGISLLLFVLLFLAVFGYTSRVAIVSPRWPHLWLLLPLLFFAGMASIRANPALTIFNVLAVLVLLSYLLFFYAAGRLTSLTTAGALLLPARVGGSSLLRTAPLIRQSVVASDVRRHTRRRLAPVLRGLLLSLPVLTVFTLLLASADVVFGQYVEAVLNLQIMPQVMELISRLFFIGLLAWLLAGGIVFALERAGAEDDHGIIENLLERIPRAVTWGFTESATLLWLVNLLFGLFVAVQFTYLFGGVRNIHPAGYDGYSYAEYARRGFFELVIVAVLSLSLILGLNWLTRRESKRQLNLFNALSTLMIALVLVMLASAWRRMNLYEATYGYTQLRLAVYVFMLWLGALLVWFLLTLWRRPEWFALGLLAAAIGFLGTLNLINPDAFIARQNVARYLTTGDLDVIYLNTLSNDAAPVLLAALAAVEGDSELLPNPACGRYYEMPEAGAIRCEMTRAEFVQQGLDRRLAALTDDTGWRRWQSWNLANYRAFYLLAGGRESRSTTR